ncbi:MAG TPA: cobalamin B12-binding domain-containing protein, partial [Proteobacteria bacterium]|nr:cobalamin B12-binding domain-containing protein [Pseudomonadota bacterium]
MKVLLLSAPWSEVYGRFADFTHGLNRNQPFGLCCLAGSLRAAGHEAHVVDMETLPRTRSAVVESVRRFKPDLVGISSATPSFPFLCRIAEIVKDEFSLPVVIGGPHVTAEAERALE